MIYASESRSLATVEFLVHVPRAYAPQKLSIATLEIPDDIVSEEIPVSLLPRNWRSFPSPLKLADLGTAWTHRNSGLLLRVPSAAVEHEHNILINPSYHDIRRVVVAAIERFVFD